MKVIINLFLFYVVTYSFGSIEARSRRRDVYVPESAHVIGEAKYKQEEIKASSDSSTKLHDQNVFKRISKQTIKKPNQVYSNSLAVRNSNVDETIFLDNLWINKPNILSKNVGKHKVKVSSFQLNHIDIKSTDEGNEISVHPKFSHKIEITPRVKKATLNENEPPDTKLPKITLGGMEDAFAEHLDLNSNVTDLEVEETSTEQLSGTLNSINEEIFSTAYEEKSNEFHKKENIAPRKDQFSETEILHPNLDEMSENMINTKTEQGSDLESRSDKVDGLYFKDEIERTVNEVSLEDMGRDRDIPKDGRLLSLFSQRNISSTTCTTPKGESGQCRRIRECLLSETFNNFNFFLQQLCLIRGVLVGICCPDNPVIEITNTEENNTTEIIAEQNEIEQPPEGCGLNSKTRIVGGTISAPHEWTWMVALLRRNRFYCGGVIINNWYILTAAHCVLGMDVKDLTVRLGEYDFNADSRQKEDISVAEIKRHAKFVTLTFQHDIALLKLQRRIRYSKFVGSICLPSQQARDYSDVHGTVVGWGTVSFGGAASPVLRQVTVPVWKNVDCDRTYFLETINDAFLCAGSPEKGEDACQGDSGGPLMTLNDGGRWEVIGIVSWGRRCGDPTYPGVYTRVTTYLDWILQNMD